jgi:hypothetical protein
MPEFSVAGARAIPGRLLFEAALPENATRLRIGKMEPPGASGALDEGFG